VNLTNDDGSKRRGLIADGDGASGQDERGVELRLLPVVHFQNRIARGQFGARLGSQQDTHGWIDRVLNLVSPGTQHHGRATDQLGVDPTEISAAVRVNGVAGRRRRQPAVIINHPGVPALALDYLAEQELITRKTNPFDRRVVYIELSDKGRVAMDHYLAELHDAAVSGADATNA